MTTASPPRPGKPGETTLNDMLGMLRVDTPVTHRGMSMIPVVATSRESQAPGYLILREALAAGTVRITEISESGSVPQLAVANSGGRPVLLVDGEELVGAKQNRIVNLTILVPARHTLPIPVSCVEVGRWAYVSHEFGESKQVMFSNARAQKARDVTRSLRESGARNADQGAVWSSIAEASQSLGVHSTTGAMSDVYARHDIPLEECERAFAPVAGQVGAIFAVGPEIVGLDVFDAADTLRAYLPKLVRGYILEGLAHAGRGTGLDGSAMDTEQAAQGLTVRASAFLASVANAPATTHRAIGLGNDLRIEIDTVTGGALEHEGRLVHVTAFDPKAAERSRRGPGSVDAPARGGGPARDNRPTLRRALRDRYLRLDDAPILHSEPPTLPRVAETWNRVEGMLLGLAIGDSLGNTSEALDPAERRARHGEIRDYLPHPYAGGRPVGLPSDDTQLAFWTLESLLDHDGLVPDRLAERFAREQIFGIGRTVKAFLRRYKSDRSHAWHELGIDSAGNGALMRIAPVLVPHVAQPGSALWADVVVASALTHNDRASTSACVAFVRMLWELLAMRRSPEPEWWLDTYCRAAGPLEGASMYRSRVPGDGYAGSLTGFVDTRVRGALAAGLSVRQACDSWHSGAFLLETVPSVLYILARHGHDPEDAIVRAVNDSRDNDTIAAIVGAAMGALHGRARLPAQWVDGLLGRTGAGDDGQVQRLIMGARAKWGR